MLAFSWVVVSCYDDKGSYDYTEVNEIVIDELGDGYSMIFKKDTLKIKPKLLFSLDSLTPIDMSMSGKLFREWLVIFLAK